jgi:transcriptional regulator with XRE-family HTH domain
MGLSWLGAAAVRRDLYQDRTRARFRAEKTENPTHVGASALARQAGVPVSTLRNWEGDRGFPNLPALLRIAEVLGVPVERLAEGVEDPAEAEPEAPEEPRRPRKRKMP